MSRPVKAAVIGSGFGGLASAIRLQAAGFDTTLFEKRDKLGGRAYVFEQDGFRFDAGPTVVTAPHCLIELFELSKKRIDDYVKLVGVNPFYRLHWESGNCFDYSNDDSSLLSQIQKKSPKDVEGYLQFMKYSQEVFREGYENLVDVAFLRFWDMVRAAPQLIRLKAYRSVYQMVSHYISDEELRQAFSFHSLLIGGNPFSASSIYTLIHTLEKKWGVFFPIGGTGALVNALGTLFTDLGGVIRLDTEIDKITEKSGRVNGLLTRSRETYSFDLVVSNADVMHTYEHLLKGVSRSRSTLRKLKRMRYSMSLFLIYFGTKKKYPHLMHHNILFGSRYRELLNDIFDRGILANDFSLYLHAPGRTDPSLAPPGCDAFYALSPVPHLGKYKENWKVQGPLYANRILEYLEKHHMPGLRSEIITQKIFTPLDFQTELNAHLGSAFSLEPTLIQSAYFRLQNRDRHLKGLYFVGAGTHPGAGIPGVVNSAKATVRVILGDLRKGLELGILEPSYA